MAAYQNREQSLNKAERYYNTRLPETRGAAHKSVTEARSAAQARVKLTQGEAENYMSAEAMTGQAHMPEKGFWARALGRCGFDGITSTMVVICGIPMEMNVGYAKSRD